MAVKPGLFLTVETPVLKPQSPLTLTTSKSNSEIVCISSPLPVLFYFRLIVRSYSCHYFAGLRSNIYTTEL